MKLKVLRTLQISQKYNIFTDTIKNHNWCNNSTLILITQNQTYQTDSKHISIEQHHLLQHVHSKCPRWRTSTSSTIWVNSFYFHNISFEDLFHVITCWCLELTFRHPSYKMYFNSVSKLFLENLLIHIQIQIVIVIVLVAIIIETCQRISRSNLKRKSKYYAQIIKPHVKFLPKIKLKSGIHTHLYLSGLSALAGNIHPQPWHI